MKIASLIAAFIFIALTAHADEPPSWSGFDIVSDNGQYVAKISTNTDGGHTVSVYYKDRGVLYWSCDYVYDGYTWGALSNDGSTFAYVSFWYYGDEPVVYLYREGNVTGTATGEEFGIPIGKLKDTVSHRLWLCEGYGEHYRFAYPKGEFPVLEIDTIDGSLHILVLGEHGKISISH
jgi:hypothetical protein